MAKVITVNLNCKFVALNKEESTETISATLGQLFAYETKEVSDPLKVNSWAEKLYDQEVISLDESDFKKFKETVDGLKGRMTTAMRAQLIRILDAAEAASDKKAENATSK